MQRDEILDLARGIGILLVIAGHVPFYTFQVNLIYFFHMPLFFFLSGVMHKKQTAKQSLIAASRLIGNYSIYGLLYALLGWLYFGHNLQGNLRKLLSFRPEAIWEITGFGVFWFIVALAIVKIICALQFIYRTWVAGLLLFLLISFIAKQNTSLPDWLLILGPALISLLFFQLGQFYAPTLQQLKKRPALILLISAALYLGLAIYSMSAYNGWQQKLVNFAHVQVFNPFIALLLSGAGILLTLTLSYILSGTGLVSRVFRFYGRYSFILFVTHLLLIELFSSIIPEAQWGTHLMFSRALVLTLTIIACSVIALFLGRLPHRRTRLRKLLLMQ